MTRKNVAAMRRTERERRHRIRTGGLEPRQHGAHERIVVDARHPSILRGEALLERFDKPWSQPDADVKGDIVEVVVVPERVGTIEHIEFSDASGSTEQPWALAPCPRCGATGDAPCLTANGTPARTEHAARTTV